MITFAKAHAPIDAEREDEALIIQSLRARSAVRGIYICIHLYIKSELG